MKTPEPESTLRLAQLRMVRIPNPKQHATGVSLMELRDVKWEAPSDWLRQMVNALGRSAEMDGNSVKSASLFGESFEITVQTNLSVSRSITLRHDLGRLFESWCKPVDPHSDSQQEFLTREVAETRIREILTDNLGAPEALTVEEAELEYGSEWSFRFAAGTNHYVGTASKEHRLLLFHAAHPPNP